uniref:Ovule protein n=1 Tax=Panagrellus redivivus TaxID=6233 RepID=A0A7E4W4Y3_PANRE
MLPKEARIRHPESSESMLLCLSRRHIIRTSSFKTDGLKKRQKRKKPNNLYKLSKAESVIQNPWICVQINVF